MAVVLKNQEEYKFMNFYSNKICRRYDIKLTDSSKSPVVKRNAPPGFHGPKGVKKRSNYGLQLAEKQRAKVTYNIREKQFRLTFDKALKMKGDAGENLMRLLETRLDNVIYRLRLATSRPNARQVVNHAHVRVNGVKTNIPSFRVKEGDVITIKDKSMKSTYFKNIIENLDTKELPSWLSLKGKELEGKILHLPGKDDFDQSIDTQAIIEYYSK